NIGMTALWYNNMEGGAAGYGEIGGLDIRLNGDYNPNVIPLASREEATGWTQYAFVVYPREEAVGMELRLRYWHHFEGIVYWDDVSITNLGGVFVSVSNENDFTEIDNDTPEQVHLLQNYPNPFNPTTKISFQLQTAETVNLNVFNILGQRVATILTDARLNSGLHTFNFDASSLPSGIYIYQLSTDSFNEMRRMTLIK
ncbi:MAG: T9SS type A sorting domain-containing protein, partial [Bacteroidota bacterium]